MYQTAQRIQWGMIGTSPISEVMAHAIQASCTGQLAAIASRSAAKAKVFSDTFSIPKAYDHYQALLDDPTIDAIYLGLPNHLHKEWIIRCALAGKHVLCEKPFVISADEMQEVITVVEKQNVICMEALMYRYHPFIKKLHSLINEKIIGEVKLYHAMYAANIAELANPTAGGSIYNLGCYPISLVRLLANAEPIAIQAMGRMNVKNHTDNQASVLLKFPDHSMAMVSTADDIEKYWQFEIFGTQGQLKVITNPWMPDFENKITLCKHDEKEPINLSFTAEKPLYTYQIDTLGRTILHGKFAAHDGISLTDSLGNITVLEEWLKQIKIKENAHAPKNYSNIAS